MSAPSPVDPVPLQAAAWASLARCVDTGDVPPALLLIGPPGVGKVEAALALARALNCEAGPGSRPCGECRSCRRMLAGNHPNLRVIYPVPSPSSGKSEEKQQEEVEAALAEVLEARRTEKLFAFEPERIWPGRKASIQIDHVRSLKRELSYSLGEGNARAVVLAEAHTMTTEAANALLKILEEPGPRTHWILTTSRPGRLLPTIRSRCRAMEFEPVALEPLTEFLAARLGAPSAQVRTAAAMAQGSPAAAVRLLGAGADVLAERDQALELWRAAQSGNWGAVQRAVEGLRFRCYRDRGLVGRILKLWLLFVRDLLLAKAGLPESQMANLDRIEAIRKTAAQVPWETLNARFAVLEDCLSAEGLNVAPEVLLYSALTRLTQSSGPTGAPARQVSC